MRNKVLFVFLALILAVVPLLAACAAPTPAPTAPPEEEEAPPAKARSLSLAFFAPMASAPGVSLQQWADEVEKRTNGKVEIDIFGGSSLLGPFAMFDGVLEGVADIGCSCPSYEPGRFPLILGMEGPAVDFPSNAVSSRVLWEVVNEFQPESLDRFKLLYMFTAGPNHIITTEPLRTFEDFEGAEIRCSGAVVPMMEALGAAPVAMPMSALPEALQKGVVKGYVSSLETLYDFKFGEICHYATDWSPSVGCLFAVVMSKPVWNSLPADVQKVIDDLALEHSVWTGEFWDGHDAESLQWAIDEQGFEVITISPQEKAKWEALLEPLVDEYLADMAAKGLPGEEYLARLAELCEKYSK